MSEKLKTVLVKTVQGRKLPKEIINVVIKQLESLRYIESKQYVNGVGVKTYKSLFPRKIQKPMTIKINGIEQVVLSFVYETGKVFYMETYPLND